MCRGTVPGTGWETLLSEWQEAGCRDRRLLLYSLQRIWPMPTILIVEDGRNLWMIRPSI